MNTSPWVSTSPPAKLNLFLEVLARRPDGFHELDTVMVAIDWRDEIRLRWVDQPGIQIRVDWLPSREQLSAQLGEADASPLVSWESPDSLLFIPTDERNLIHRTLARIQEAFDVSGGWEVDLYKRIPSGAGMGGASSDAAATIRLAFAALAAIDERVWRKPRDSRQSTSMSDQLAAEIASQIGSDVPFFLGQLGLGSDTERQDADRKEDSIRLPEVASASGRGEKLAYFTLPGQLHFVVIYPATSLSTAEVYQRVSVPSVAKNSRELLDALANGATLIPEMLHNALAEPACGLSSRIAEALECLQQAGLKCCQMTGSGSACYALAESSHHAASAAEQIRERMTKGALIQAAQSCSVPSKIHIT